MFDSLRHTLTLQVLQPTGPSLIQYTRKESRGKAPSPEKPKFSLALCYEHSAHLVLVLPVAPKRPTANTHARDAPPTLSVSPHGRFGAGEVLRRLGFLGVAPRWPSPAAAASCSYFVA